MARDLALLGLFFLCEVLHMSSESSVKESYSTEQLTLKLVTNSDFETSYDVYLKGSNYVIGNVTIMHVIKQIWYRIDSRFCNKGYATEAVAKVLEVTANKDELYLDIHHSNQASIRVAEKLGFTLSSSDSVYYQYRLPQTK